MRAVLQDLDLDLDGKAGAGAPELVVATSRHLEAAQLWEATSEVSSPLIAILERGEPEPVTEQRARCRFLVRRPVHPVVLRLLIQRVLYRGTERRRGPRAILGIPVQMESVGQICRATLLDLSMRVARLTARENLQPGTRIQLHVSAEASGLEDGVDLSGEIIRAVSSGSGKAATSEFAVSFDTVEPSIRRDLSSLLVAVTARDARVSGVHPGPDLSRIAEAPSDCQAAVDGSRVLVGTDLSFEGMRVDRCDFRQGDRLTLSLFGGASVPACGVEASVERVDVLGCRLQFLGMSREVSETLTRLMAAGEVSRGCQAGSEPVVISEWLH